MNLSLIKIRKYFPKFNKVAITEMEFWRAAKKAKIIVRTMPLIVNGYYKFERGRHYIFIDSRLSRKQFLHTALHEFCHFLFDVPRPSEDRAFYQRHDLNDPREKFADAFALAGMMPFPELEHLSHEDISDNPALLDMVKQRIAVLADFRM